MTSWGSDLRVEMIGDEILATLPQSHYAVTYYKPKNGHAPLTALAGHLKTAGEGDADRHQTEKELFSRASSYLRPPRTIGAFFLEITELPNVEVFGAARGAWPR